MVFRRHQRGDSPGRGVQRRLQCDYLGQGGIGKYRVIQRVTNAFVSSRSKLTFVLTTRVYGVQGELVDETLSYRQLWPQIPFAENKLKAEVLLAAMGKRKQFEFVKRRFDIFCFACFPLCAHGPAANCVANCL